MNFFFIIFMGAVGGFFVIVYTMMMPLCGEIKAKKYGNMEFGKAISDYIGLMSNLERDNAYRRDLNRILYWLIGDFFLIIYSIIVMTN